MKTSSEIPHAAVLTPAGRGAVAVIGVWGCGATSAVERCFLPASGRPFSQCRVGRIVFGRWNAPDGEELVVCRRGEEEIEVHGHGGSASAGAILESLAAAGCRIAEAPDWLARRQSDRTIVEAHQALARAPTARVAEVLLDQAAGALRQAINEIIADVSAGGDGAAREHLTRLLARAVSGRRLTDPLRVVLTGPPNVGKSSLINALLGFGRVIVHDQPGTTRDVVTASTVFAGRLVELSDTAGIRATDDDLEAAGVARARQQTASADLVIAVFDRSQPWTPADAAFAASHSEAVIAFTKADLPAAACDRPAGMATSATTNVGIEELIAAIVARPEFQLPPPGAAVPFTERQIDLLRRAQATDDTARAVKLLQKI